MTQVSDFATMKNVKVELSQDGSTWFDFSGESNMVVPSGGTRNPKLLQPVLGKPVLVSSPPTPIDLSIKIVWRGALGSAAKLAETAYARQFPLYARYAPQGGASGQTRYRTAQSYVTKPPYPGGNVEDGKPILIELNLRTSEIVPEVVP